jgi:hypothetical protein
MTMEIPKETDAGNSDRRDSFLIAMYSQLWNNINRHITVVWQSVGILAGAFALFALVEKHTLSFDWACSLMLLIAGWVVAHTYDANTWFNRNITIVANIERQFLWPEDSKNIHFYFTEHRASGDMLDHFKVHRVFGVAIGLLILLYHFLTRVVPGFGLPWSDFDPNRAVPYFVSIGVMVWIAWFQKERKNKFNTLLQRSPGIAVPKASDEGSNEASVHK